MEKILLFKEGRFESWTCFSLSDTAQTNAVSEPHFGVKWQHPPPPYISQCAGDVELEVKAKKYWTTNRIQEPGFLYIHQVEIMQPSQKIVSRIAELKKQNSIYWDSQCDFIGKS